MSARSTDPNRQISVMARRALDDVTVNSPSLQPEEVQMALLFAWGFWLPYSYVAARLKVNRLHKRCSTCKKVGYHSGFRHWKFKALEMVQYLDFFLEDPSDTAAHQY